MKLLAVLLIAFGSLLSGCVVYDHPHRDGDGHYGDRDGRHYRGDRDYDRDGVPNWRDRRPNDPNRY